MTIKYEIEREQNRDPDLVTLEETEIECSDKEVLKRIASFVNEHPNSSILDLGDEGKWYLQICEVNELTHIWYTMTIEA